ncbi:MAG: RNA polymerase sigma factor [Gemmataceae bacterium]
MGRRNPPTPNPPDPANHAGPELVAVPPESISPAIMSVPLTSDDLVALFNDLRDELVSTLTYVLGSRDDAADATQDTFLKCWRARETIGDVQNLRAWIFRVGLNTARDVQRSGWAKRSKPLIAEDVLLPARDPSAAVIVEDEETVRLLRAALLELRAEEREVFLLRQNGELTYEQIAELRGLPVGTVKTQMRTALQKLRKILNPEGEADSPAS